MKVIKGLMWKGADSTIQYSTSTFWDTSVPQLSWDKFIFVVMHGEFKDGWFIFIAAAD